MRLIDADALKKILKPLVAEGGHPQYRSACKDMMHDMFPKLIDSAPTIDAAPVVHGKWTMHSDLPDDMICTVCGKGFDVWKHESRDFDYCPSCGAKMDKEDTNNGRNQAR